jgi:hypothetical protein
VRALADEALIRSFMRALGAVAEDDAAAYFVGGATAVLRGVAPSTIDIDLALKPEREELLRALPRLKIELNVNVELTCARCSAFGPSIPQGSGGASRKPSQKDDRQRG